jgi:hypothetical protein
MEAVEEHTQVEQLLDVRAGVRVRVRVRVS